MIFFDIDETLLDQRRAECEAARAFLHAFAHVLPHYGTVEQFCTRWRQLREAHAQAFLDGAVSHVEQRRRRMRELFSPREADLSDCEADARYAVYHDSYRRGWTLFEDVMPCLDALAGQRLGIISNGNTQQQLDKLDRFGVRARFQVVLISEEIGIGKPHPDIFLHACELARVRPRDCVYVGDRLDMDARAAQAAGLRGIWLARHDGAPAADVDTIRTLAELA